MGISGYHAYSRNKGTIKTLARKYLPRIVQAAVYIVITYLPFYFLSSFMQPFKHVLPIYSSFTDIFATTFIVFLVASVITKGTIYQHAFNVVRSFVTIMFFLYTLNNGIITLVVPIEESTINIMLDLKIILAMLLLVSLVGIAKNIVQAIHFVSIKNEIIEI